MSHKLALSLNPVALSKEERLSQAIKGVLGVERGNLTTDEAYCCLDILRVGPANDDERALYGMFESLAAGTANMPVFKRMVATAMRERQRHSPRPVASSGEVAGQAEPGVHEAGSLPGVFSGGSAPVVPPVPEVLWHVAVDGQPSAGMRLNALKSEVQAGRVTHDMLVWSASLGVWTWAGQVPALGSSFQAVDAPPPPIVAPPPPFEPKRPEPQAGDVDVVDLGKGAKLEMVFCPPGEFMMGSANSDNESDCYERPQHRVRLAKGFWMGKYPVTQAQWRAVTGKDPSCFKGVDRPVEQVSWDDCQTFIASLNRQASSGKRFRLPLEAEWEYACRAGTTDPRYGSHNDIGWYADNSDDQTHPLGQLEPNGWGLYDMLGNVWEWCQDDWHHNYKGAPADGSAWGSGTGSSRVCRGGSWCDEAIFCRAAQRHFFPPGHRDCFCGFRLAKSL